METFGRLPEPEDLNPELVWPNNPLNPKPLTKTLNPKPLKKN